MVQVRTHSEEETRSFGARLAQRLAQVRLALAIAFVLPEKEINLVSGVMQVFTNFFDVFGMRVEAARMLWRRRAEVT